MNKNSPNVYFVGGFARQDNVVGILAYLSELEDTDAEHTRFYMYRPSDDYWAHKEVDHEIVSLAYKEISDSIAWYLLSKRGVVITITSKGITQIELKTAGTGKKRYGYVSQIREIGGELYICGMCRQVYKKKNRNWVQIADSILAPIDSVDFSFESIDGSGYDNIYAVGWQGEIFHYNGEKWSKCDSPTNLDLNSVRCIDKETTYICGNNGLFLYGYGSNWNVIQDDEFDEDLWSVEIHKGTPYVAHRDGISKFDGSKLIRVDTKIKPGPDSGVLHANNQILWSFGNNDLSFYNGKKWKRVICPDNK